MLSCIPFGFPASQDSGNEARSAQISIRGKEAGGGWEPRGIILSEESKYEPSPSHVVIPIGPIQYYSPTAPMDITIGGRHSLH